MNVLTRYIFLPFFLLFVCGVAYSQLSPGVVSPSSQTISSGATPSALTATAPSSGPPFTYAYQWQISTNGSSWTNIFGATTGSGYAPGTHTATRYYRLYTEQVGTQWAEYSNVVVVIVGSNPLTPGTISPSSSTVSYGGAPSQLSGTSPDGGTGTYAFFWQTSNDNSTWTNIPSVTSATIFPPNIKQTTFYRRGVTSGSETQYSNVVTVTVTGELTPGTLSSSMSINYNTSPGLLSPTAAGGGLGGYSYQWQSSSDGSNWTAISGATAATYTPANLTSSIYYRRAVTSDGITKYTGSLQVTVYAALTGGVLSPATLSVNYNTSPGAITSAGGDLPAGGSGTYTYQWQQSTDNVNWSAVSGATALSYTPGALTAIRYFRRQVTSNGVTVNSSVSTISVYPQLVAGTLTGPGSPINYNTAPAAITGTVATGGNNSYTYQWQSSPDGSTWTAISGATTQNYSPPALTATTQYRRGVTSNGATVQSNTVVVTVYPQLLAGTVTGPGSPINYNTAPATLTATVATGGNSTYAYQWQSSPDGSTWTAISGATAQNYAPPTLTVTTQYRRSVTSNGVTVQSNAVTVTVYGQLVAGTITGSGSPINYNTAPATITGTVATGGNSSYAYQWQSSPDGSTWTSISGGTAQNYFPPALTATTQYRRSVTSNGVTVQSNTVTITVYPQLVAGTITAPSTPLTAGNVPSPVTGTAPTGGSGSYVLLWQSSANGSSGWTTISGATAQDYAPPALSATIYYRRGVTSNGLTVYSNTATITVIPVLVPGTITGPAGAINYNTAPAAITGTAATGGSSPYTYQWQRSGDSAVWTNLQGATSLNYTAGPLSVTTWFRRRVTAGSVAFSNVVKITVNNQLDAGALLPGSTSIPTGTSPGQMGINPATGGNGTYTYQWQNSSDGETWGNVSGATAKDYTPGNLSAVTFYRRQVTSGGVTALSAPLQISIIQPQVVTPGSYSGTMKLNFIRTWEATAPEQNAVSLVSRTLRDVKQITRYADGLGRPLQTVVKQGALATGSSALDLVTANQFDGMGRQPIQYMTFAANNTGGNTHITDGLFKRNPIAQLATFGSATYPGETHLYGVNTFEASVGEQLDKSTAPGTAWAGSDRGTQMKYYTNTAVDDVKRWNCTNVAGGFGSYAISGVYKGGELFKSITIDEHGKQVIEFKDKENKIILKKVQLTASSDDGTGRDYTGWLSTYYIYDEIGQIRCIIQPKGVDLIRPTWILTDTQILAEQCFRYEYDARGRVIRKKLPGAGEVYMVYDARDRLVLSQDGGLRASVPVKWAYMQYDAQNRPVASGLWPNSQSLDYHLAQAATSTNYPALSGHDELSITHYDDYQDLPAGFVATASSTDPTALFTGAVNTTPEYALPWQQSKTAFGLITWTKTKVLGTAQYLTTVNYYDDYERLIQVQAQHIAGGTTVTSYQYNFTGKLFRSVSRMTKPAPTAQNIVQCMRYAYDELGRLTKLEHGVNFSSMKTLTGLEYNAMGQLKTKKLGTHPVSGLPLETFAFDYNIRGWLQAVNKAYLQDTTSESNYFGFELGHDRSRVTVNGIVNTYATNQFNGNISGVLWKSTGDDRTRKYDYSYDALNRLVSARFTQLNGSAFNTSAGMDFSVRGISYDANGNITNLMQWGWKPGGSKVVDSLTYYYENAKSNRLKAVIDQENDQDTKLGDFRSSEDYMTALGGFKTSTATDYSYDAAGNLTMDKNKDITLIEYNHLNQPSNISFATQGSVSIVYDANGLKLKKVVTDNTTTPARTVTTQYVGGIQLETVQYASGGQGGYVDSLTLIGHEEGKIRFKNGQMVYDYFIKDHLGNVRMVLTDEQQTDAYPVASMEMAQQTTEQQYYSNLNTRADKPPGYPTDTYTNPNDKMALVRGDAQKVGPGILLKVMAGDKFNLRANSWYKLNGVSPAEPASPLTSIVGMLAATIPGATAGKVAQSQMTSAVLDPGVMSFLDNRDQSNVPARPKAYVNYLLLDEQFKPVITGNGKNSGFEQVGTDQEFKTHLFSGREITKNGYLYIYTSNETPNVDVYFDNLQVTHIRGPLVQEDHYYPWGLPMAALGAKALSFGGKENLSRYNGKEHNTREFGGESAGLEWYDFGARMYDPQIGRWHVLDPKSEKYSSASPYSFAINNPIRFIDPNGQEITLSGSQEDIDAFLELLYKLTGTRYVVKNGKLEVANAGKQKKRTAAIRKAVEDGMNSKNKINLAMVRQKDNVYIDKWKTGEVDIEDLEKLDNTTMQAAHIGHFIAERTAAEGEGGYGNEANRTEEKFHKAHDAAKKVEVVIVSEMNKDGVTVVRVDGYDLKPETTEGADGKPVTTIRYRKVYYDKNGKRKFIFDTTQPASKDENGNWKYSEQSRILGARRMWEEEDSEPLPTPPTPPKL